MVRKSFIVRRARGAKKLTIGLTACFPFRLAGPSAFGGRMGRKNFLVGAIVAVSLLAGATTGRAADGTEGELPVGADGKPLNLDFETGTLKDWTAVGEAFLGQPVKGDTVAARRGDMRSRHQGQYWIGGYEIHGDRPQGTLTSAAFKVTQPLASFLVGGGSQSTTCVELVRKKTGEVFYRASGQDEEDMRREVVDLRPVAGEEIFIRLVDRNSGGWGHVNFDDFRFHRTQPNFPPRKGAPDVYPFAGLPPEKAAAAMTVPEGFTVQLFAGEPDVHQPIAFCLDDRGRLWVAEAYSYPVRRKDADAHDRIVIFEDSDGDGKFDKRTVFMEGLNLVSGLEVGFGGVWIGAAPYLMFVPFKDGEDKPSGPAQVLLDGWAYQDTHETLNTFRWGPDGWLYGCQGVFTHSRVGKPGTPDDRRVRINAGIWRYHPTRHVFEVFAEGTSNPWGLDFDPQGQAFIEACVIPHAFHIIQGGRYQRQAGTHFNPHTYADIQTIADHLHWQGANPWAGNTRSDSTGGGHAHCGLMIYQGGAWPREYADNKLFMGNVHGHRFNMDVLKRRGSGFVASHGPDFLLANDAWARFINLRYGPDGNVYFIDWYDKQACHTGNIDIWDRSNGRVYKVSYRGIQPVRVDLADKSDLELVQLQLNDNEWFVQHGRRLLQERAARKTLDRRSVDEALDRIAFAHSDALRRLRGLWALHATGGLSAERARRALADANEYVRAWAIQLALEGTEASPDLLRQLTQMARDDASPVVRLYLSAGLQRLPASRRWDILEALLARKEDAADPNLPLMNWYAAEPLAGVDPARALQLAGHAAMPPLLNFMVRRVGSAATAEAVELVIQTLARAHDVATERIVLKGLAEALKGRRNVAMPASWPETFTRLSAATDAELSSLAYSLGVTFGDEHAFAALRKVLADARAGTPARQAALASLLGGHDATLPSQLQQLVGDPSLRAEALRALAAYDDPKTPGVVLAAFPSLTLEEKRDALNTLAARVPYALALLDAVAAKKIAARDISADLIRQIRNLRDKALDQRIADTWGIVRSTPADRARLIATYRKKLTEPSMNPPDVVLGRALFVKTCQQCHTLFGTGGKVGPDITGSNRANLDYLLENILDPSAVIPKEYAVSVLNMKNGRVITGIVRAETPAAYTVVIATETLTVSRDDVESRFASELSMMPDDILKQMSDGEVRALVAYLQSPVQSPFLATAENVKDFFNGKDLTGWNGNPKLWTVEDGVIVGRSPGLKRNEFLRSHLSAADFRLTLKIKLTPDEGNSGVQFRTEELPDGEVKGPQADVGKGWWGKLYEENARGILSNKSGEPYVKPGEWNEYEIVAVGPKVKTFINGKPCVDLEDPALPRRGIFAFQIHAGGPMEVRFKDLRLELLAPDARVRR
jgi:putative membrane-bound dehydrogenase-like protein